MTVILVYTLWIKTGGGQYLFLLALTLKYNIIVVPSDVGMRAHTQMRKLCEFIHVQQVIQESRCSDRAHVVIKRDYKRDPVNQPVSQLVSHLGQSVSHSVSQSINQSITQLINQSISQSINQSVNQ